MNALILLLLLTKLISVVVSQYSAVMRQVKGYSLTGSTLYSFQTDSLTACSVACRRYNCDGFAIVNHECKVYDVSGSTIAYVPGSQSSLGFLNLESLAVPRAPLMTVPSSPWGTPAPPYNCARNKGVNAINVWYDVFDDFGWSQDDVGVTQVRIICSGTDGIVDSSSIQGIPAAAATKRSFQCPSASFISAVRFMIMPDQGPFGDDAAMVGLSVMCNDPASTVHALASGEGTAIYPWTSWLACDVGFVVCGFSLKIDPATSGDVTNVNGMSTSCCLIT